MIAEILQLNKSSREYNLEKIKWVVAEQYVGQYGMTIPEAYAAVALTYVPQTERTEYFIDFSEYQEAREEYPIEDQWLFDVETVEALTEAFREGFKVDVPESALAHIFPSAEDCTIIYTKVADHILSHTSQ